MKTPSDLERWHRVAVLVRFAIFAGGRAALLAFVGLVPTHLTEPLLPTVGLLQDQAQVAEFSTLSHGFTWNPRKHSIFSVASFSWGTQRGFNFSLGGIAPED